MRGRQPNPLGESLTPRQKRVLAVVGGLLIVLAAGTGIWAAVSPGSYGRSSHGCVNVTWTDGRYLFDQTLPRVLDGQNTTPTGQPATEVVILP